MKSNQTRPLKTVTLAVLFTITILSLPLRHGSLAGAALSIHIVAGSLTAAGSLMHLITRRGWVKAAFFHRNNKQPPAVRRNLAIDFGMAAALLPVTVSGLLLALIPGAAGMEGLHMASSLIFICLTFVHMQMHSGSMKAYWRTLLPQR